MIASLPWYDMPELSAALDGLWSGIARHLRRAGIVDVPSRLDRRDPRWQWRQPSLVLSQACGTDVVGTPHAAHLRVLACPRFDLPDCPPGHYRSWIAVREDHGAVHLSDLRGARCAINELSSYSGHFALRALVAPLRVPGPGLRPPRRWAARVRSAGRRERPTPRFFGRVRVSGSHVRSLELLARGEVDVAAIDAMTWAALAEHRPAALHGVRTLGLTAPVPAPPYVTSASWNEDRVARLRDGLLAAGSDPRLSHARSDLRLAGICPATRCRYRPLIAAR